MNVLVTGCRGQLGNEIQKLAPAFDQMHFLFTGREELDITNEAEIDRLMQEFKPDAVVNCAAYTAVDKAEQETELALLLNATAPAFLAKACRLYNARMVQISTDYVFDGHNYKPYKEDEQVNPQGKYAISKAEGEKSVLNSGADALVIRTSWLYSAYGSNFVKTIRRAGAERGQLRVVADQIGSPTWARDLAETALIMLRDQSPGGIYHYANEGVCSWFDFAQAIIEISNIQCIVSPTDTAGYPLPAPRPYYSVFDKSKITKTTGQTIPYWRESLKKCIALLNEPS